MNAERLTLFTILPILLLCALLLSGCSEVTYSIVNATDGSYYYDVSIDLADITEGDREDVCDATRATITALPLHSEEHTSFLTQGSTFVYREHYGSITELYMARGITGYESNEDKAEVSRVNRLYKKYSYHYSNAFADIDKAYSRTACAALADTDDAYRFTQYYESGIKNIYRLFLYNYALKRDYTEEDARTLLASGLLHASQTLGLGDFADCTYRFVYATDKKSITTNADKLTDNTSSLTPEFGTLYKDALYYHVWSGDLDTIVSDVFVISQTSPDTNLWYILAILISAVAGLVIAIVVKARAGRKPTSRPASPSKAPEQPLGKDDDPFA